MLKKIQILILALIMVLALCPAALADEQTADTASGEMSLTYQKALEMALSKSNSYRNASLDIDRTYEVRKNASDKVKYAPLDSSNITASRAFIGLVQADLGWQMSQKTNDVTKDAIALSVKQSYNAVLQAAQKKKLADLSLQDASAQASLSQLKYQNGMASAIERSQYKGSLSASKESREAASKVLDDAYDAFNILVGLPSGSRPQLTDLPELKNMEEVDLDTKVSQVKDMSPSVWLADQKVSISKLTLDLFNPNDTSGSDNYEAKKIDVNKATNTASDEKNKLEKSVRAIYYKIRQLEGQYTGLQANLEVAEQGLKIARVKYDIGMAIKADLIASELAAEKLKQQMFDIAAQHQNLVMAFEKPWTYQ